MKRGGYIKRKTPLRRKTWLKRSANRIPPIRPKRAAEKAEYRRRAPLFLKKHPYCQYWLAECGFTEEQARAGGGYIIEDRNGKLYPQLPKNFTGRILRVPRSDQVHHKNKRRGAMLNDESFWMAVCRSSHEAIENDKKTARAKGYLLNF